MLDRESYNNLKQEFKDWVLTQKWKEKVVVNIKPGKFKNQPFHVNTLFDKITSEVSEGDYAEMFDDEVMNWIEDGWEEDYENEYDWYVDHSNNEAEDVVIDNIMKGYDTENMTSDEQCDLQQMLLDHYK